jgi:hypothetical protein
MKNEELTQYFRKSINILFVSNPRGTSLGVLMGVVLDGVIGLFSPYLKGITMIDIAAVKMWHMIGLGVLFANLPEYLKRKEIDPSILNAINYIEDQKVKKNISAWQAKQMYMNLHQRVLENITLDKKTQDLYDKIQNFETQLESEEQPNK